MFGNRLKELRIEHNKTQKELAILLECHQSMITRWEKGQCEPTESVIRRTAILFNVTADYLIGLEDYSGTKYVNSFNNSFNGNNSNITIK